MRLHARARLPHTARLVTDGDTAIRIGGRGVDFVPEFELRRWDQHVVRLRLLHDEPGIVTVDQQAIVWTAPSLEARWYRLPDQRFECATIFYGAVPACVRFAFETSAEIETTRQGPLEHVNPDGSHWGRNPWGGIRQRPAEVVDSFASYVPWSGDYSRCGGWNYRSGKVAHLFRPWVVDAIGRQAWCEVELVRGILTIRIPAAFRDSAIGPVLLDPTFGYSGTAASDDNVGTAHILYKAVTNPASSGTLDSITIRGRIKAGSPTHEPAIYSDLVGAPVNRLAAVNSGGTAFTGSDSDITTNISYGSLASGTQYWLGSRCNGSTSTTIDYWFKFDASGGTANFYYLIDSNPATTPWELTTAGWSTLDNERTYIFGTYTAAGAAQVPYQPYYQSVLTQ